MSTEDPVKTKLYDAVRMASACFSAISDQNYDSRLSAVVRAAESICDNAIALADEEKV